MSTVAHTILKADAGQKIKIPGLPKRRIIVTLTASYKISSDDDANQINRVIEDALQSLLGYETSSSVELDGEEPEAIIEIHNIPEESGS